MGLIPQDVIDQVLAAHDIVEVVGRYLPLKQAGRAFKTLCPFHEEKTPSFTVNPDRQSFKCFGCGKGGNVFGFLIEHEGVTFPEAVRSLARERGITVPDTRERTPEEESLVERVRQALTFAQALYIRALASDIGREARTYLEKRGYDDAAVRRFGLGYAPGGWDRLIGAAGRQGISPRTLEDAGLALARAEGGHYDRFRHRITFPISDLRGRVLTFGARALSPDDDPKYLNGPETSVFRKSGVLYALDLARDGIRKTGEALLMEGYTDVLMTHLHGLDRAVAGMGTAFTPQQAMLLRRFAERVVLVYDADEAGRTAAERTLDILLPAGLDVRVAFLPEGRDVDEILLEEGKEALEAVLAGSLDVLEFKLRVLGARHDLASPRGRAQASAAVVQTIVKVPSPIERDQLLRALAERLGGVETEAALRQEAAQTLGRAAARPATPRAARTEPEPDSPAARVRRRTQAAAEEFLLTGLLFHPSLRESILRAVGAEDFEVPAHRRILGVIAALQEEGDAVDPFTVGSRLAEDAEAQTVLAGLDTDETLEERIPFQIEFLERRRHARRRADQIRRDLGEAIGPRPSSPGPTSPADETLSAREPSEEVPPAGTFDTRSQSHE